MPSKQPDAAIERMVRKYRRAPHVTVRISAERYDSLLSVAEIRALITEVRRETIRECALVAGGWTGPVNTSKNAAVVSEVCREISRAIRQMEDPNA